MRASRAFTAALVGAATVSTFVTVVPGAPGAGAVPSLHFEPVGFYDTGLADIEEEVTAAEIVAYDQGRVFLINTSSTTVDALELTDEGELEFLERVDLSSFGPSTNSVATSNGMVAVLIDGPTRTAPGRVVLLDRNLDVIDSEVVGAVPDMATFTPDGRKLLVANEGEPNDDYTVDPAGSVTVLDVKRSSIPMFPTLGAGFGTVRTAGFGSVSIPAGVRIYGPGATAATDLEPEYITVAPDGKTALVALQEANAVAELDVTNARITQVVALGFKDHSVAGNGLDASDRDTIGASNDGRINIQNWPVFGMYQPDGMAGFTQGNQQYLVTANEGDTRDYDGFGEEVRVGDADLDPIAFPDAAALQDEDALGRLTVSTTGDLDDDGDLDQIQVPGARSISVRRVERTGVTKQNPLGVLGLPIVFDSGDDLEQVVADQEPDFFNSDNAEDNFDNRSDNKGPEPEGVTVGQIGTRRYAFATLERQGGFMVYDITNPNAPTFVTWANNRSYGGEAVGPDSGPEGIVFVPAASSPTGEPVIVVGNEVTGTVTAWSPAAAAPV